MHHSTRYKKLKRLIALTLALSMLNAAIFPSLTLALTPGSTMPEYASFEPVDATDMVNLLTGDFTYSLPILNVPGPGGGYPLAMFYHAGISPEQEASWLGLGWNINPGSINRYAKGIPDDWRGKTSNVLSYSGSTTITDWAASVNVGFNGISGGVSVDGGSYKSIGGSVSLGMGIGGTNSPYAIGASIGTRGVGAGVGMAAGNYGGRVGLSVYSDYNGNVSGSASLGAGGSSLGYSLSSTGGVAFASAVGNSFSLGNNAIGSSQISSKLLSGVSIGIPISIYGFATFDYSKVTYWYTSMTDIYNFGSIYMKDTKHEVSNTGGSQYSNVVGDSYENPFSSLTYNNAQRQAQENSLSFPDYDFYQVSGQGIGGSISPKICEYGTMTKAGNVFSYCEADQGNNSKAELIYYNYNNFSKPSDKIYFQFDYDQGGYSRVMPGKYNSQNAYPSYTYDPAGSIGDPFYYQSPGTLNILNPDNLTFYNPATQRAGKSKYIEYFTNAQIAVKTSNTYSEALSKGFIESESQIDQRGNSDLYDPDGIGAYSITAEDGKTYHYSVPVYQFEEFQFYESRISIGAGLNNYKKDKYAYDWLLTSVTGPDYVDRGTIEDGKLGTIGDEDLGYWVKFDYGKWTDGYMWRNPNQEGFYSHSSDGKPYGSYSIGRKQIYYLNDIKTKTHTAYFIKNLRSDGKGKMINSTKPNDYNGLLSGTPNPLPQGCDNILDIHCPLVAHGGTVQTSIATPEANQLLKLDKIILVNNNSLLNISFNNTIANNFKTTLTGSTALKLINRTITSFKPDATPCNLPNYNIYNSPIYSSYFQDNVLDVKDVQNDIANIEQKAIKVIEFNQDYLLCGNTPNSNAAGGGKLTLNSVKIYGNRKADIMPAYLFDYNNKIGNSNAIPYDFNKVDNWGYYSTNKDDTANKPNADAWSLNEITTPLGGKIKINYETDTYSREAVFGAPQFTRVVNSTTKNGTTMTLTMSSIFGLDNMGALIIGNFYDIYSRISTSPRIENTINRKLLSYDISANTLTFEESSTGTHPIPLWVYFKAGTLYGGGIRVKEILLADGAGNNYKTSYSYSDPTYNITSGVTSYAPTTDDRYIPYVNELPGPMVMYEYVTVEDKGLTNDSYVKVRYKFDVLKTSENINSQNFSMGDHFKVEDIQSSASIPNYTTGNHPGNTFARSGLVTDNKGAIGRILEVASLNKASLVQDKVTYQYQNPTIEEIRNGITQETFNDLKRYILSGSDCDHVYSNSLWTITSSSRISYPSVLKSITSESNGIKNTTTNTKYDFYTGVATETESVNPSGEKYRTKTIPAYAEYGGIQTGMGSKVYDVLNNKNMLVQETSSKLYSVDANNTESLISANVQTWSNLWNYREYLPATNSYVTIAPNDLTYYASGNTSNSYKPIWRKYQSYVWKSLNNSDGSLATFADYVWGTATQNAGWQKTNEVTRYNHNSQALEAKDINNRFVSTKLGYNDRFPIASAANAKYGSFAFSGAEDAVDGTDYFGGEVAGTGLQSSLFAHTGNYSIALAQKDAGFIYTGTIGNLVSNDFKKGQKMRASVWVYNQNPNTGRLVYDLIKSDGSPEVSGYVDVSSASSKLAGNWYLLTLDFYIPANTTATTLLVYASHIQDNFSSLPIYFDDFRVHPQEAVMTSAVYDETTGWVTAVLDADNFATKFTYDAAGRLIRTDKETLQGFKKVSENTYHYR